MKSTGLYLLRWEAVSNRRVLHFDERNNCKSLGENMVRVFFIYFYSIVGEICEEYYIYVFDIYNIAFKYSISSFCDTRRWQRG